MSEQSILFVLLTVVFGLLIWGRWRYDLVAFAALLTAVVTGVIPVQQAFSGFGHPAVVVPNGFRTDGTPTSITFMGRLHGESEVLALAHAYQQATEFHLRRPPLAAS